MGRGRLRALPTVRVLSNVLVFTAGCQSMPRAPASAANGGAPAPTTPAQSSTASEAASPPYRLEIQAPPSVAFIDYKGDASTWRAAPELSFEVEPPIADARTLRVTGVLTNTGKQPREAVTLAGGTLGLSTNPWNVTPDLELRTPLEQRGGPEVYPYPVSTILPPGASVRYIMTFELSRYRTAPAQELTIAYRFELWNARKVGSLRVRLADG